MFEKKFVRVESLALMRAYEMVKEVGIQDAYYSFSELLSEAGLAHDVAEHILALDQLGIGKDEVGDLAVCEEMSKRDVFLERHYQVVFNDKSHKVTAVVSVVMQKESRGRDWRIVVETLFKTKGRNRAYGLSDTVIYRDWRSLDGKTLQSIPRWTIFNPSTAVE